MGVLYWAQPPSCSKGDIDRAGAGITDPFLVQEHIDLIEAWRASFNFPLNTFQGNLRYRARRIDDKAVIGQRLKRFRSIQSKLVRGTVKYLSSMQDIAGCRGVVAKLEDVHVLTAQYRSDGCVLRNDYIRNPKPEGYRGIHIIGTYSGSGDQAPWNGHKVEIQLRTTLQHHFATAMETVTTFSGEPLKFGAGDQRWLRFFALMGTAISLREGTAPVPSTPTDASVIASEVSELCRELRINDRLNGWREAMGILSPGVKKKQRTAAYVLTLDPAKRHIQAMSFTRLTEADAYVAVVEKAIRESNSGLDVVQVRADSMKELKKGYPNYYADTNSFIKLIGQVTSGRF